MRLHHLRNATLILHIGAQRLLVDPMLGEVGSGMAFRMFRGERRRNPIVPLPEGAAAALEEVTGALVTHRHPDHLDETAIAWLRDRKLPVFARPADLRALRRQGLAAQDFVTAAPGLGLAARSIPTRHGHGLVGTLLGEACGWYVAEKDGRSVYITGDTVLTPIVRAAISELRPDLVVAPAGAANFGVLKDLLFPAEELLELAELAPGRVLFNHQEALDHCPHTRAALREALESRGLLERCFVPEDGEIVSFS